MMLINWNFPFETREMNFVEELLWLLPLIIHF